MKIAIDLSMVNPKKAGIGHYAYELCKSLVINDPDNFYLLITHNSNDLEELASDIKSVKNFEIIEITSSVPNFSWLWRVSKYVKQNNIDLIISPSNFTLSILNSNTIQIVHDLAPIKHPEFFGFKSSFMYKILLKLAIKRAKIISTISNTTFEDISLWAGNKSKFKLGGIGHDSWVFDKVTDEDLKSVKHKYNLPDEFILSLSTLEPRKNHLNMIKTFKILKDTDTTFKNIKYVIGGKKGWYFEPIFKLVDDLNLQNEVLFLGYVDEKDLAAVYDLSKVFVYVSFWEGLGLPAVNAFVRKKWSVVGDSKVFHDTMGASAFFANASNPSDIASKIQESLNSKFIDNPEIIKKYDWKKIAANYVSFYKFFESGK